MAIAGRTTIGQPTSGPTVPQTYYPNLAGQPQVVQDAVKRAFDAIYQLRSNQAKIVTGHNALVATVNNSVTAGTEQQTQIVLTDNL